MLKIYGSELSSPVNKVRFAANELGLEYEFIKVNLRDGENQRPDFLKLNPAAKVPVIDDNGFILFESGAIIKYLSNKQKSSLYPADLKQRAIVDQWMDFVAFHIGLNLGKVMYNRVFAPIRKMPIDQNSIQDGLNFLGKYLPVIDAQLGKDKFLAGAILTLADITLLAALDPAEVAKIELSGYKNIIQWRNGLKSRPFYTKCFKEYGEPLKQMAAK